MSFLPNTARGFPGRAALAGVLVIGVAAGATAVAGLLQVNTITKFSRHTTAGH